MRPSRSWSVARRRNWGPGCARLVCTLIITIWGSRKCSASEVPPAQCCAATNPDQDGAQAATVAIPAVRSAQIQRAEQVHDAAHRAPLLSTSSTGGLGPRAFEHMASDLQPARSRSPDAGTTLNHPPPLTVTLPHTPAVWPSAGALRGPTMDTHAERVTARTAMAMAPRCGVCRGDAFLMLGVQLRSGRDG